MNLINCPECGKLISPNAVKCIHCGFPQPMTTCSKCGANYNAILDECPKCGFNAKREREEKERLKQEREERRRIAQKNRSENWKKNRKKLLMFMLIFVALALVSFVGWIIYSKYEQAEKRFAEIHEIVVNGDFEHARQMLTEMSVQGFSKHYRQLCYEDIALMSKEDSVIAEGDSLFAIGDYLNAYLAYDKAGQIVSLNRQNLQQKKKDTQRLLEVKQNNGQQKQSESRVVSPSPNKQKTKGVKLNKDARLAYIQDLQTKIPNNGYSSWINQDCDTMSALVLEYYVAKRRDGKLISSVQNIKARLEVYQSGKIELNFGPRYVTHERMNTMLRDKAIFGDDKYNRNKGGLAIYASFSQNTNKGDVTTSFTKLSNLMRQYRDKHAKPLSLSQEEKIFILNQISGRIASTRTNQTLNKEMPCLVQELYTKKNEKGGYMSSENNILMRLDLSTEGDVYLCVNTNHNNQNATKELWKSSMNETSPITWRRENSPWAVYAKLPQDATFGTIQKKFAELQQNMFNYRSSLYR